MSKIIKRKRLLVDRKVQGSLILRVVAYWTACVITLELLGIGLAIASGPDQPSFWDYFTNQDWRGIVIRIVGSAILLLPIVYDMLRLTNRIAGPVYRIRHVLRKVADTGKTQHIQLREGDYLRLLADELNFAMARLAGEGREDKKPSVQEIPRFDEPLALLR